MRNNQELYEESDIDLELRSALARYPHYTVVTEVGRIRFQIERSELDYQLSKRKDSSNEALMIRVEIDHDCNWIVIHQE